MKFLYSDTQDYVDPEYDFLNDRTAPGRKRYWDDCYAHEIPENLRFYFDMEKFARDLEIGGDFNEFRFEGTTYTCTNAACI